MAPRIKMQSKKVKAAAKAAATKRASKTDKQAAMTKTVKPKEPKELPRPSCSEPRLHAEPRARESAACMQSCMQERARELEPGCMSSRAGRTSHTACDRISCPARERTAVNPQCVQHVQCVQHDANLKKCNRVDGTNLLYLVNLHA